MTKTERRARQRVKAWCESSGIELSGKIRHVFPLAYVVGRAAPKCLIVARPWFHSEPQVEVFNRENPLQTVHDFDDTLTAGDWCTTAYVTTTSWSGTVAVAAP